MRKIINLFSIMLILSTMVPCSSIAEEKQTFTIGVVPQFEIRHLRKIWNPILNEIEKSTGYKLELKGSPTIPDFEKELYEGEFDFAYMNPYHMILAEEAQGYIPLTRDVGRKLSGIIVVRNDSAIRSIKDLEGKKIAFPAPNALGASMLIRADLRNKFNINFKPVYVKTHSSVYLNVIVNQASAGGGVQKTFNQQKDNIKSTLHVLYRSTKVSPHPLAAHPRIPEVIQTKIKSALLEMGKQTIGKALLEKIPMKKIGVASMKDYNELKKMGLDEFHVPK